MSPRTNYSPPHPVSTHIEIGSGHRPKKAHTSIQEYKDHFTVLGSTRGNSAKDHAIINFNDQYAGVPIFWLGDAQAADDYADFCDGSWDQSNPGTDSAGAAITFGAVDLIYTGTLSTCERSPNNYLGATNVTVGQPSAGSGSELQGTTGSGRGTRRLYGLSYVFEVGEPQTSMQQQANSPAEGNVSISGTPQVGQTLAANSAISDPDGISGADYAYQWYAGDSEISGATEILYTLASAEQGKRITVTITFTDDAEHEETLTSEPTAAVTGLANSAATGQPTITGTAQVGQTLNASTSAIADADGLDNAIYAYQWLSGQDPIANATASSYTLTLAEGGRQVALRVTFTDDAGNEEILTSEPTAAVETGPNSPASGQPRVTGSALLHATLGVDTSAIADANGLGTASFSYQWLVTVDGTDQEIAGATAATYRVGSAQEGRPIKVRVSFTDDGGYTETLNSPALEPSQPTGLTASISDGAILLSWQAPSNFPYLYKYRIQRERPESDETDSDLTVDTRSTVTSYRDSQVEDGVLYRYRVQAGNYWGQRSPATEPVEIRAPQGEASEIALLTAEFLDTPSSHDGQTAFTFELRLSEEFDLSHVTLRDHAFTVTGGEVTGARRLEEPSNIRWEITVAPDGNGDVTVVLPATTDCTAQGAICTGDGKMLSGGVTVAVAGPQGEEQQQTPLENTPATGAPTISGTAQVGQELTADTSAIADADGTQTSVFNYQWLADDANIQDATGSSYTLNDAEEDKAIKVQVSFTDDRGNAESLTSAATAAVAAKPNSPATGAPTITGTPQVGETLTADTTGIADGNGLDNIDYTYQWTASGSNIDGATGSSFTLTSDQEGDTVQVRVTFTDDDGFSETLTSAATEAVAAANNPPTGLPAISGTPQVGQKLTADTSGISDQDGLSNVSYRYQWTAGGSNIDGATGSSFTLTATQQGQTIQVRVAFTDDGDNQESLTSEATAAVAARPNSPATGLPTINGTAQVGQTLTANKDDIADADGTADAEFSYQWIAGDAEISGATGPTHTLSVDDVGQTIKVRVTFTDDQNNEESLTSVATVAVAAAPNRDATGAPTISGTPQVEQTLTADTSGIADEDGLTNVSYAYQWLAGGAEIDGAASSTLTLTTAQQGKTIQVRVDFEDDLGNSESLTSAATEAVAAKPTPLTASFSGVPESHTGSWFEFTLTFSEEVELSYVTLRDHAFTESGGNVTKAVRKQKGSNLGWTIRVRLDGNGAVTIVLPKTTNCDDDGAVCTGDGRMLSNRNEFTVSGPGG